MSSLVSNIALLHTHYLPPQLRSCATGVYVVEQINENLNAYYGVNLGRHISIKEFFQRFSSGFANSYSIEGDISPDEICGGIDEFVCYGLRYVLPWHSYNKMFSTGGTITTGGQALLKCMSDCGVVLDCTHMEETVLDESLKYYQGPVVFSHSVFRLPHNNRKRISNLISDGMLRSITNRPFLVGIPLVDDLVTTKDPLPDSVMASVQDVADQILYAAQQIGVSRVCIGGDYFNFKYYSNLMKCSLGPVQGMCSESGFVELQDRLRAGGFSDHDIQCVFWGNMEKWNRMINERIMRLKNESTYWSFSETFDLNDARNAAIQSPIASHHPTHAWIALNNYCNLSCRHCRRTYKAMKPMEKDISDTLYERLLSEVVPGLKSLIIGGNNFAEVTKATRFGSFVTALDELKVRPEISLQTNGSVFPLALLEKLVAMDVILNISVEGGTIETTRKIRGLGLDFVEYRLKQYNEVRKACGSTKSRVVLSFTAMKSTINELPFLVEFAELHGVDEVNIMFLLPPNKDWNSESVHDVDTEINRIISETRMMASAWRVQIVAPELADIQQDKPCVRPWTSASIDALGAVRFCCLTDSPVIGNLNESHFSEIWNSKKAQSVRQHVNTNPHDECCQCVLRNFPRLSTRALRLHLK